MIKILLLTLTKLNKLNLTCSCPEKQEHGQIKLWEKGGVQQKTKIGSNRMNYEHEESSLTANVELNRTLFSLSLVKNESSTPTWASC